MRAHSVNPIMNFTQWVAILLVAVALAATRPTRNIKVIQFLFKTAIFHKYVLRGVQIKYFYLFFNSYVHNSLQTLNDLNKIYLHV